MADPQLRLMPTRTVAILGTTIFAILAIAMSTFIMTVSLDRMVKTVSAGNKTFANTLTEVLAPHMGDFMARGAASRPGAKESVRKIERLLKGTDIVDLAVIGGDGRVVWATSTYDPTVVARAADERGIWYDGEADRTLLYDQRPFDIEVNKAQGPSVKYLGAYEIYTDVSGPRDEIRTMLLTVLAIEALLFGLIILLLLAVARTSNQRLIDSYRQQKRLAESVQRAEDADLAKSVFISEVSHDLRTPLNSIIGFSEVLKDGTFGALANEQQKSYVENIHQSGQRLLTIITDLFDLGRFQSGKMELQEDKVDLGACLETTTAMLRCQPDAMALDFDCNLEPNLPPLLADRDALQHIVQDLLLNAIKHTLSGSIVVAARLRPDRALEFSVSDTGIGIPENELASLTERFNQVDGSWRRKFEGTGLGLALVKAVMSQHGGDLNVSSEVGVGTVVTCRFPRRRTLDLAGEQLHQGVDSPHVVTMRPRRG